MESENGGAFGAALCSACMVVRRRIFCFCQESESENAWGASLHSAYDNS